jgi:MFS superfamily sulfate permease-like transporter
MNTSPCVSSVSALSASLSSDVTVPADVTACKLGVATATALLVGVYQVLLGVLGLGCVTQYMSAPVMRGFVTGSAVHVAVSQLQYTLFWYVSHWPYGQLQGRAGE